ncbi:hypothetical protein ACYB78_03120 [Klebsiella pneumoniae]
MTTDITELAQREKFEAWFKSSFHPDKTGPYIKDQLYFAWKAAGAELVEALEKAQQRIDEPLPSSRNILMPALDGLSRDHLIVTIQTAVDNYSALHAKWLEDRQRIAELESRTVTVKLPKDHVDDADLFGWGVVVVPLEALKEACTDAGVTVEITDAGIKVEAE